MKNEVLPSNMGIRSWPGRESTLHRSAVQRTAVCTPHNYSTHGNLELSPRSQQRDGIDPSRASFVLGSSYVLPHNNPIRGAALSKLLCDMKRKIKHVVQGAVSLTRGVTLRRVLRGGTKIARCFLPACTSRSTKKQRHNSTTGCASSNSSDRL
jgi:hypothetical protein